MKTTGNPHRVVSKAATLSPLTGHPSEVIQMGMAPGFEAEARPLLSFILKVLDRKHRQMVSLRLAYFLQDDFQIGTPEVEKWQRRLSNDPSLWDCAVDGMISALREMADMWIDSGKSGVDRDVDSPADRNVEDVLPGRSYSLALLIYRSLLMSHPVYKVMRRDGSQTITETYPRFDPQSPWKLEDVLQEHGRKMAAFYFAQLLDSPFSRHLSRCDHCNKYFAYQRARLRTVFHGVFCPACEGQSSMKRTEHSRKKRLDTAAKAWLEWNHQKRIEQRQWVADRVSEKHSATLGRRWVSQNLPEILKRVEALQNAKG